MELTIPPRHFDEPVSQCKRVPLVKVLLFVCTDWIVTELEADGSHFVGRVKTSILLAHLFDDVSILKDWWQQYWEAVVANPAFIVHEKALVCIELGLICCGAQRARARSQALALDNAFHPNNQEVLLQKCLAAKIPSPIQKWLESDWEPVPLRMALRCSPELLSLGLAASGCKASRCSVAVGGSPI